MRENSGRWRGGQGGGWGRGRGRTPRESPWAAGPLQPLRGDPWNSRNSHGSVSPNFNPCPLQDPHLQKEKPRPPKITVCGRAPNPTESRQPPAALAADIQCRGRGQAAGRGSGLELSLLVCCPGWWPGWWPGDRNRGLSQGSVGQGSAPCNRSGDLRGPLTIDGSVTEQPRPGSPLLAPAPAGQGSDA